MIPRHKAQVMENSNPAVRCDIFSCIEPATEFIGRPDGPRNLAINLCAGCYRSVLDSIIEREGSALWERKKELEAEESTRKDKEAYGGKEFVCSECGEIFYAPHKLGSHKNQVHKEAAKSGADVK